MMHEEQGTRWWRRWSRARSRSSVYDKQSKQVKRRAAYPEGHCMSLLWWARNLYCRVSSEDPPEREAAEATNIKRRAGWRKIWPHFVLSCWTWHQAEWRVAGWLGCDSAHDVLERVHEELLENIAIERASGGRRSGTGSGQGRHHHVDEDRTRCQERCAYWRVAYPQVDTQSVFCWAFYEGRWPGYILRVKTICSGEECEVASE